MSWTYFSQNRISDHRIYRFCQQRFVASVLKEWAHGIAFKAYCYRMALVKQFYHLRQKRGIVELNLTYVGLRLFMVSEYHHQQYQL